jgi:hypothetical protein
MRASYREEFTGRAGGAQDAPRWARRHPAGCVFELEKHPREARDRITVDQASRLLIPVTWFAMLVHDRKNSDLIE